MSTQTTHDWRPTTTSTAVALSGTFVVVSLLLWQVDDVLEPVALGAVGTVLFGVSCWLLSQDRFETVSRPLVSVLTLPVALGLFGSTATISLLLASRLFPVADGSLFSTTALVIAGHAGVAFGSVLALLGVVLGVRTVVTPTTLRRYGQTTLLTALVPGVVCLALAGEVIVFEQEGPLTQAWAVAGLVWTWLTAAEPTGVDLAGFVFTVALAVTSVLAAVIVLPVAELLGRRDTADQRVRQWRTRLTWAGAVVIGLHVILLVLEVGYSGGELGSLFGWTLYGLVETVATARSLRYLLLAVTAVALLGVLVGGVVRRLATQSRRGLARVAGPLVGGSIITLIAYRVAEPVYEGLLELVLQSLPPDTEAEVQEIGVEAARLYGMELYVIMLAFALVAATLCFIVLLRVALFFGYLSRETPGFSLASAGLFVGVVAAGTIGAPAWLIFAGVICCLLVWDAGRFGTTLGREIGPETPTRDTELVHIGATLAVGLLGALAGGLLLSRVESVWTVPAATTSVALVSLAVGLVCFVVALR